MNYWGYLGISRELSRAIWGFGVDYLELFGDLRGLSGVIWGFGVNYLGLFFLLPGFFWGIMMI